jgi:methionyl-tRNA formyltransferase
MGQNDARSVFFPFTHHPHASPMSSLSLVFGGTPEFAVPALEALLTAGHRIAAVYTQPDRPAGRGQKLAHSAVKECALRHGLHIEQPATLRSPEAAERLASFKPDAMIVVAYGLILPAAILAVPRLGCINIHGSLLPRWRGAAPIQRALLAGDAITGVSIMCMDTGLDTGPVLTMSETPIGPRETAAELHDRLATLGARALVEALPRYANGELKPTPQPATGATYASKLRKEEALLDWRQSAEELDRRVRAFNPWPVAETRWKERQLRIWEAAPVAIETHAVPGTVIAADASGIVVATGSGALVISRLQMAGRTAMRASDFLNAQSLAGAVLGP